MNNWLNRLERKYGRYGIPNLTNILVAGQILVLAIELFVDRTISFWLGLSRSLLLQGQVWRAISFIFIPFPAAASLAWCWASTSHGSLARRWNGSGAISATRCICCPACWARCWAVCSPA